jgi:hypothetical protein
MRVRTLFRSSVRGGDVELSRPPLRHFGRPASPVRGWRQATPLLMPHDDVAAGRPITPLHGGHVGLLCTAGLLNGVFGDGENRHIARWRSVKHVTTFVEEDGDAEIIHHRERWTNELRLVYSDGRTLKLTETP